MVEKAKNIGHFAVFAVIFCKRVHKVGGLQSRFLVMQLDLCPA